MDDSQQPSCTARQIIQHLNAKALKNSAKTSKSENTTEPLRPRNWTPQSFSLLSNSFSDELLNIFHKIAKKKHQPIQKYNTVSKI